MRASTWPHEVGRMHWESRLDKLLFNILMFDALCHNSLNQMKLVTISHILTFNTLCHNLLIIYHTIKKAPKCIFCYEHSLIEHISFDI